MILLPPRAKEFFNVALVKDFRSIGFSSKEASILGDTVNYYSAAGTVQSDATQTDDSIIWVNGTSGANAGVALPALDISRTKRHIVMNDTAGNIRAYTKNGSGDLMKIFGGGAGAPTYVTIPAGTWYEIIKMDKIAATAAIWVALT